MKKKRFFVLVFSLAVFGAVLAGVLSHDVFADGFMVSEVPSGAISPLGVKYHRVKVEIREQSARTEIDQVFRNDLNRDIEAIYLFPLPEDAAISDFAMYMNGVRVSGEVIDRDEALRVYEDIVRRMKDPGILEYAGRNMFRARVYPVPALGESRVKISYEQTVPLDGGLGRYVYPLDTERFSPTLIEEVSLSVNIHSSVPIKSVYSPTHDMDVVLHTHEATAGFEERDVKPDRDFVLYFTVSGEPVGLNLLGFRERGDGHFMMMLSPGVTPEAALRKDVVFVVDTSGSMRGAKLAQAKAALERCVDALREEDSFNIIRFATGTDRLSSGLLPATFRNRERGGDFIAGLEARGGTNINEALQKALHMLDLPEERGPRMIVFITDGEPTIGVTNRDEIVRNAGLLNRDRTRIFTFGVGSDVNTHLLDTLAYENGGLPEYIKKHETIETVVPAFFRKVSEPVLTDVSVDFRGVEVYDTYPVRINDIFRGQQVLLFGRYRDGGNAVITLEGRTNGEEGSFVFEQEFPRRSERFGSIPRLWAMRKIGYLLDEIRRGGESEELVDEIVSLSKEYGIITPYTSFLIIEEGERGEWAMGPVEPSVLDEGRRFSKAMKSETGPEAVSSSEDIRDMKKSATGRPPVIDTVKHVGNRTFFLENGTWTDTKYKKSMRLIEVRYLSRSYFDLLAREPGLGRYFAIGDSLVVVYGDKCYSIQH